MATQTSKADSARCELAVALADMDSLLAEVAPAYAESTVAANAKAILAKHARIEQANEPASAAAVDADIRRNIDGILHDHVFLSWDKSTPRVGGAYAAAAVLARLISALADNAAMARDELDRAADMVEACGHAEQARRMRRYADYNRAALALARGVSQ